MSLYPKFIESIVISCGLDLVPNFVPDVSHPDGVDQLPCQGLTGQAVFLIITLIKPDSNRHGGVPLWGGDGYRIRGYGASAPLFIILSKPAVLTK